MPIAFLFLSLAAIHDILVASGFLDFFYLSEFAYALVIASMAYSIMSSFIDVQVEVETLNKRLDEKVLMRTRELKKKNNDLERAFDEVQVLSGFIPICSSCKQIRDDKGYWSQIEHYISTHSDAQFSHGICPEYVEKLYPEFIQDTKA